MSQRKSGYARIASDDYQTREAWVVEALVAHLPPVRRPLAIWEPAAGEGFMVRALRAACECKVWGTDIRTGRDFLKMRKRPALLPKRLDAIVTNPPYTHAVEFIEQALRLSHFRGFVAMLLRCDFDSAATRQHLFRDSVEFCGKVVLTKRINWFEHKIASPSYNHAWFIWDKGVDYPYRPVIYYEPKQQQKEKPL